MFNEDHTPYNLYRPTPTIQICKDTRMVEIDKLNDYRYEIRLYINEIDIVTKTAGTEITARKTAAKLLE